jgi:hypothetical protein
VRDALVRPREGVAHDQVRVHHAVGLPEEDEPAEAVGDLPPRPEEVERERLEPASGVRRSVQGGGGDELGWVSV